MLRSCVLNSYATDLPHSQFEPSYPKVFRAFQSQLTQICVQQNSRFRGVFLHKIDVTNILKAGVTINLVYLGSLYVHPVTRPSDFCGNELAV